MKNFEGNKDPFNYGVETLKGMEKDALEKIGQMETSSGQPGEDAFRSNISEITNVYVKEWKNNVVNFQAEFSVQEAKTLLSAEETKKIFEEYSQYFSNCLKEYLNESSEVHKLRMESMSKITQVIEDFERFVNDENKESYKKLENTMIEEYFNAMDTLLKKIGDKNEEINKLKADDYGHRAENVRERADVEQRVFVDSLSEKIHSDFEKMIAIYQEKIGQTLNDAYRYYFISNN